MCVYMPTLRKFTPNLDPGEKQVHVQMEIYIYTHIKLIFIAVLFTKNPKHPRYNQINIMGIVIQWNTT